MSSAKKFLRSGVLAIIVLSVFFPALSSEPAHAAAPAGFSDKQLAEGLNLPTSMAFAPDGRLFIAEKDGTIRVIKDGELLAAPFASLSVNSEGERGLQGMAFDPDFASNGYLYVYYTVETDPIHNRVSRLTEDAANPDRVLAGSEQPLLDLEPLSTVSHNGGGLEFGPDGKLYVSTGDNYYPDLAQSLTSRFGKILRINPDGTVPTDNPFYDVQGAYKEIWALGLRNPFSFAFASSTGDGTATMYINDVGQDSWEEINVGSEGANYGWPMCEGRCSDSGFSSPVYSYRHPSDESGSSITGGTFYEASRFPSEYQGSYFFGDYAAGFIKRLAPDNRVTNFLADINSPVDVAVGPDGHLYYLSIGSGQVREVQFTTPGNYEPTAVAEASETQGLAPLAVEFDGSQSMDPNSGDTLSYTWDFGDGSDPATGAQMTHVYNTTGPHVATLTVDDGRGGTSSDTIAITVGNPPDGTIQAPSGGTRYDAGDTISFSGSATDAEDGDMESSAFDWKIDFHHNTHTHPFQEFSGVKSGTFTVPTIGETDDDVWYRVYLTVADSSGLMHQSTRDILPNTSTVTISSNVTGLELMLDGQPQASPHSFVGVVGAERTLEAPATQVHDGVIYEFESWSDGGERAHTIATPQDNADLTAHYSAGSAASQHTLTIRSGDLSGNELAQYATIESPRGTVLEDGYTPLSFTGYESTAYTILMRDYRNSTFDHWENDSKNRIRTINLDDDAEITAYFRAINSSTAAPEEPPSLLDLIIDSVDSLGNALTTHAEIESTSDGTVVHEGNTPLNYSSTAGGSYEITVEDAGDMVFDRWDNNSTNRTRTVEVESDTVITSYYRNASRSDAPSEEDDGEEEGADGDAQNGNTGGIAGDTVTYPPLYFASNPLAKFQLQSSRFNSEDGTNVSWAESGEEITIAASFRNYQQAEQSYAAIIQTEDSEGITADIGWVTGALEPGEIANATRTWTAPEHDIYTVKIFVWDDVEQTPDPLAKVTTKRLIVT